MVSLRSFWRRTTSPKDVIQNAIDGAEAYMKSLRPQLQRQQLCQAEKIWYLAKMNPPKKF